MRNDFAQELMNIEKELLALKTATEYTSIKSASSTTSQSVSTGLYKVIYNNYGEPILSNVYVKYNSFIRAFPRTPSGNSQVIEVNTTRWNNATQSYETLTNELIIVSNSPVASITRL